MAWRGFAVLFPRLSPTECTPNAWKRLRSSGSKPLHAAWNCPDTDAGHYAQFELASLASHEVLAQHAQRHGSPCCQVETPQDEAGYRYWMFSLWSDPGNQSGTCPVVAYASNSSPLMRSKASRSAAFSISKDWRAFPSARSAIS